MMDMIYDILIYLVESKDMQGRYLVYSCGTDCQFLILWLPSPPFYQKQKNPLILAVGTRALGFIPPVYMLGMLEPSGQNQGIAKMWFHTKHPVRLNVFSS